MNMKMESRSLKIFWNKIHGGFLAAIQTPQVIKAIEEYRTFYGLHGHARTTIEMRNQIEKIFLKDAGLIKGAPLEDGWIVRRDDNKVFIGKKEKDGTVSEWHFENPFHFTDGRQISVPEWKYRLI